jgi:hypothetical protein
MGNVTFLFVGLIAHVLTTNGVQRAVFVNAPMHDAQIIVQSKDVIYVSGFEEAPAATFEERVFVINEQHVTLNPGAGRRTNTDVSFARYVPSLTSISDATEVRDEVEDGELFDGVHAYLDLNGGSLSAVETSVREVVFRGAASNVRGCLAMSVAYVVPAGVKGVVLSSSGGATMRLRAGAVVHVINTPPPSYTMPHFHMYGLILKNASYVASPYATGNSCSTDSRIEPRKGRLAPVATAIKPTLPIRPENLDVDCTSSRYP